MDAKKKPETPATDEKDSSLKDVVSSVAAAFLGVQSDKNRERDFS